VGGAGGNREERCPLHVREGAVDKWEIADDGGEEAESESSFAYHERTSEAGARNDVAQTESEESRALR